MVGPFKIAGAGRVSRGGPLVGATLRSAPRAPHQREGCSGPVSLLKNSTSKGDTFQGNTAASQSHLTKIIKLPVYQNMTIRNWNTTTKLLALMEVGNEKSRSKEVN